MEDWTKNTLFLWFIHCPRLFQQKRCWAFFYLRGFCVFDRRTMMQRQQRDGGESSVFYELSSLVMNILRTPPSSIPFSDHSPVVSTASSSRRTIPAQITPAGFASLLLGISLALMLCGSVTFFIGFMMMPWVIGLVMFFYVAAVVSCLSMIGRSIICYATAPPRKDIPAWKLMWRGTWWWKMEIKKMLFTWQWAALFPWCCLAGWLSSKLDEEEVFVNIIFSYHTGSCWYCFC